MRQMKMVNLYFTRDEVHEALRQWCERNHPSVVSHFGRQNSMDWTMDGMHDSELCLCFDGEIEDMMTSDETRIFVKR